MSSVACQLTHGAVLSESVSLPGDVELMPLGHSTTELPSLPLFQGDSARGYLGLTLLRLGVATSPAPFRPNREANEADVRSWSADEITLELVCVALSLATNQYVALSRMCLEHPRARGFRLSGSNTTVGTDRAKPRRWKKMTSEAGRTVITPHDDEAPCPFDAFEVDSIRKALQSANRKLPISVDRWRKSMREDANLVDQFIDLRVALEAI